MTLIEVLQKINNNQTSNLSKEVGVFLSISLHTKGVRPFYTDADLNPAYFKPKYATDYQAIFDRYLFARHPREPEVTRNWRLSQYRPLTKEPFDQITDIIRGAIFQDGQYTITLPNDGDQRYIWEKKFEGFDLIGFFSNKILNSMLEDPNGYLVRIPSKPSYETNGDVEVLPLYICIKDVIQKPETGDFIFSHGNYIYWINSNIIIRFIQQKDGRWIIEDNRGYYAHLLGYIPATVLGGRYETDGYYTSYLHKAVPIADEFVSNYSAKQMVDKEASHPYIQQMSVQCSTCQGKGTLQEHVEPSMDNPSGLRLATCGTCHGKGQVSINPADRFEVPKEDMDKVAVRIINPDISINNYHKENARDLMTDIMDALNLTMINEAQSGTAKAIDQEKLYQFLMGISNHIFDDLIFNTIKDIIRYRNVRYEGARVIPTDYEFTFVKPQQFNIKTALELLGEIAETQKAGLPVFIRRKMVSEFVDKRFSSDDVFAKKSKIIAQLDPLFIFSIEEVQAMQLPKSQLYFSQILPIILDEIESDMGQNFLLDSTLEKITGQVNAIFNSKYKIVSNSLDKSAENTTV